VDHIVVFKTSEDMDDGIRAADIPQELIAQPFPYAGPYYQTCNIHDLNSGGDDPVWFDQFLQFDQSMVGYGDHTEIRNDGPEEELSRLRLCAAQGVEKGRFAYVGESDNACL
jgi:hypothetical protein